MVADRLDTVNAHRLSEHNNLKGLAEIYEGARRKGVKRILFASSNHAFGMHSVNSKLKLDAGRDRVGRSPSLR